MENVGFDILYGVYLKLPRAFDSKWPIVTVQDCDIVNLWLGHLFS